MVNNFLVSTDAIAAGRIWTLITSVFSHNMPLHIFINMFVLSSFGPLMEDVLGNKNFLIFYLAAGIAGSLAHCCTSSFLLHDSSLPALGASGAISGVLVLFSLMYPKHLVYILGLIPIPALIATLLFVGSDVMGLIEQSKGNGIMIGHGAHLGGAVTGVIYFISTRSHSVTIKA